MSGGISNSSQRYQTVRVLSKFLLMIIIPSIAIGQIQPTQNYLNHNSNNDQRHLCHGHHQTYQKDPSHDRSETLRDLSEPGEHHHHKVKKLSSPSSVPKQGNLQGGVDHDDLKERQDREKAVESVRGLITALRSERNPINFMFGTLRGLFKFLVVRLLYETLVLRGFGLVNFLVVSILWNSMIKIMGLVLFIKPLELLTKILKKASPLFSLVFLAISLGSLIGLVSINVFKKISNHLHHNHHSHTSKISSSKRSKSVQKDLIDCSDDLKPDVIVQNASIKEEEERQKEFKLDKRSSPSKTLSTRSKDKNQKDISNSLSSSNPKKPRVQLFEKLRQISENYEDYDVDQEGFDDKIQSQTQSGTSSPFSSPLVFKGFETNGPRSTKSKTSSSILRRSKYHSREDPNDTNKEYYFEEERAKGEKSRNKVGGVARGFDGDEVGSLVGKSSGVSLNSSISSSNNSGSKKKVTFKTD